MSKKRDRDASPLAVLLHHLDLVAKAEEAVRKFEGLIEQRRGERVAVMGNIPPVDGLKRRREDLLADVAVGAATTEDVRLFDERAADELRRCEEAKRSAEAQARECDQALAGLGRRLDDVREELAVLCSQTDALLQSFLLSEAEAAGAEYVKAAQVVSGMYLRIVAIDRILSQQRLGTQGIGILGASPSITIPALALNACEAATHKNHGGLFSESVAHFDGRIDRSFVEVRDEFKRLGIPL